MTTNATRKPAVVAVGMLVAVLAAMPVRQAHATTGLSFLRDSPLASFTEEDFAQLRKAAGVVLESASSRASQTWANEASGNSGKVTALKAFTSTDGRACKRLRLDNRSPAFEGSWNYTVCKTADGDWKIDSGAKPK